MVGMLQSAKPSSPLPFSLPTSLFYLAGPLPTSFILFWTLPHSHSVRGPFSPFPLSYLLFLELYFYPMTLFLLLIAASIPLSLFFRVPSHFSFCILFAFPPLFLGGESFNPPPFTLQGLCSLRTLCVWVCGVCACVCECVCVW